MFGHLVKSMKTLTKTPPAKPKRLKRYVLCSRDKQGKITCMIDASLTSMGWSSTCACLFKQPPTHYLSKGTFIARINSKDCPVKILDYGWKSRNNPFVTR